MAHQQTVVCVYDSTLAAASLETYIFKQELCWRNHFQCFTCHHYSFQSTVTSYKLDLIRIGVDPWAKQSLHTDRWNAVKSKWIEIDCDSKQELCLKNRGVYQNHRLQSAEVFHLSVSLNLHVASRLLPLAFRLAAPKRCYDNRKMLNQ